MQEINEKYYMEFPLTYKDYPEDNYILIDGIKFVKTPCLYGFMEIFSRFDYDFGGLNDCIFIDVGANTCDSALYAAAQNNIFRVYAFEPFPQTYNIACMNLNLNPQLSHKISLYPYAWGDKNEIMDIPAVDDMYHSAVNSIENEFLKSTIRDRNNYVKITVVRAREILESIIKENKHLPIVLKMDIEGSEYNCIKDIDSQGLFKYVDILILEWHYKGHESITTTLENNGFIWFNSNLSSDTGLIKAYNTKCKKIKNKNIIQKLLKI